MIKKSIIGSIFLILIVSIGIFYIYGRSIWMPLKIKYSGGQTIAEVQANIGKKSRDRLIPYFIKNDLSYPPKSITLLAIKNSAKLEIWDTSSTQNTHIKTYDIKALSGKLGPKLREGDYQVPEGIYKISGLNPNSSYHLSMKINYPNQFDLKYAQAENRSQPGSDIFIHGKALSIGCLAIGDEAIEELFTLASDIGHDKFKIIIAPTDPRQNPLDSSAHADWVQILYRNITIEFGNYKN